jgi:hypothetical protein
MQSWGAFGSRAGYSLNEAAMRATAPHFTVKMTSKISLPAPAALDRRVLRCTHNRLRARCD